VLREHEGFAALADALPTAEEVQEALDDFKQALEEFDQVLAEQAEDEELQEALAA
jgi:hypothetical protein